MIEVAKGQQFYCKSLAILSFLITYHVALQITLVRQADQLKTSPPSARIAAMRSLQNKIAKQTEIQLKILKHL